MRSLKIWTAAAAFLGVAILPAAAQQYSALSGPLLEQLRNVVTFRETAAPANEGKDLLSAELSTLRTGQQRTAMASSRWSAFAKLLVATSIWSSPMSTLARRS